jgi:hypothetical protein
MVTSADIVVCGYEGVYVLHETVTVTAIPVTLCGE